ncbi:trypsin-like serine protease [Amycolatopsis sp. PS_44_ISF1]|uniref:trypsin-like serine protease n=1 Tax=Amycolatopsis sp. PS_44_ISF1 TaxID=2974917 RepID=UPI0028DFC23B|nr:trypsin-like serine protease [Amycolatopsis sp. PS_44_ISF1]MDT8913547.1 trypsin-like serine protease [Amycolatopsis sp. PS_44_ISF1]
MQLRRTAGLSVAALSVAGLVTGPASPASAIVGGALAPQAPAGIGSLQHDHHGDPNWATCSAHALGDDGRGMTDLIVSNAHCGTVEPTTPQIQRMSPQGRRAAWALRSAGDHDGLQPAPADPASYAGAGLRSVPVDPATYHFVGGSVDRFHGVSVGIKQFLIPTGWAWGEPDAQGRQWDIMLAQLEHPIPVRGALIAPVVPWLPVRELGWGQDTPDPSSWHGPLRATLKQTDVPVVPDSDCADAGIGTDEVCLGVAPDNGGTCAGDSGGGGVQRYGRVWLLVATASRGPAPHCGTVNVYTETWPYLPWITTQIAQVEPRTRVAASRAELRAAS